MNKDDTTSTGWKSQNIVINADQLKPKMKYTLKLDIGFAGETAKTQVTYLLEVSDVPKNGYCVHGG